MEDQAKKGNYNYAVEYKKRSAVFPCHPNQLRDTAKHYFEIQHESFTFQKYYEDFKNWAEVTDMEQLPFTCALKLVESKFYMLYPSIEYVKTLILSQLDAS